MVNYVFAYLQSLLARDEEEGQGLVEYALIIVLVSIVAMVTLRVLGVTVAGVFSQINTALGGA